MNTDALDVANTSLKNGNTYQNPKNTTYCCGRNKAPPSCNTFQTLFAGSSTL